MFISRSRFFTLLGLAAACGLAAGCSGSGPQGPKPGTPGFYWAAANESFKNGNYQKASEHLSRLDNSPEFAARALPWSLVLNSGMAQGYIELADRCETGGKVNKGQAAGFRRQTSVYRATANTAALHVVEKMHAFMESNKDEQVALAFPFPSGSGAEPAELGKILKGILPQESEMAGLERSMTRRGVLLVASSAVGAPNDPAKAMESFKQPDLKVPRESFMRAMANTMFEQAQLYVPMKLDQPKRMQLLCREAKEALASIKTQTKADKDLLKKITDAEKKYRLDQIS